MTYYPSFSLLSKTLLLNHYTGGQVRYQNLMKLVVLGGLLASSSFGQTNLADLKAAMPKDFETSLPSLQQQEPAGD